MRLQRLITVLAVFLSLLIHLGIYLGAQLLPVPVRVLPGLPVEIIYTNKDQKDLSRQIVADPDLGKIVKKAQDQARLLSQLTRRVEEEMVAATKGPSKNRPPGTTLSTSPREEQPKRDPSMDQLKPQGDLAFQQTKNSIYLPPLISKTWEEILSLVAQPAANIFPLSKREFYLTQYGSVSLLHFF